MDFKNSAYLHLCSEFVDTISISRQFKLGTEKQAKTTFIVKYAEWEGLNDYTLHDFFYYECSLKKVI